MLVVFAILGLTVLAALMISIAALLQTRSLWHRIAQHENECRKEDAAIYGELRHCRASCNRLLLEIQGETSRIAGWIEAQDPDFARRRAAALRAAHVRQQDLDQQTTGCAAEHGR